MFRRAIQMVTVAAMAAGVMLFGSGAAQAQRAGDCESFPPTSTDVRTELTLCSHVETTVLAGVKYADGWGEVRIGSQWYTSATGCKLTTWLTLTTANSAWDTPKKYNLCNYALTHRNSWSYGPGVDTKTTATGAGSWTCVDLFFNNSPTPGWQRCVYSPRVAW